MLCIFFLIEDPSPARNIGTSIDAESSAVTNMENQLKIQQNITPGACPQDDDEPSLIIGAIPVTLLSNYAIKNLTKLYFWKILFQNFIYEIHIEF